MTLFSLVPLYQITRCHIPEDCRLNNHHCADIKHHKIFSSFFNFIKKMVSNMLDYNINIIIILNECVTVSHADITSSLESYWIHFKHTSNINMLVGNSSIHVFMHIISYARLPTQGT